MFIILDSEDITTDNVGCIDIQSLPFEMDDNASGLITSGKLFNIMSKYLYYTS